MEAFQKVGIFHSRLDREICKPHMYGHILERMYMGPRRTRIYGYFVILRVYTRCNWPYTWDNSPYETDVIKYTRKKNPCTSCHNFETNGQPYDQLSEFLFIFVPVTTGFLISSTGLLL